MTLTDLDRKTAAMESLRSRWEGLILPAVRAKTADAHAHALRALTDALKATPDGRPSALRLNRSPSYAAACNRLDELWAWLVGPSEVSLAGQVRDAREAFYRAAAGLWFPLIPGAIRSRAGPDPTRDQVRQVRAAAIHGYDPRKALEGPVSAAKRALRAALEQAGRGSTPGHVEGDLLAAWERRASGALASAAVTLLNDSLEYADRAAGRDLIHADHIADEGESL